ncbi:GNAT family N-acetyltransferase [Corynebacterium kroppenstedtii]|uniref:GNAT family N-acetyltransferase n=1 Tax=Corynebacterium sp. PCR 32 TaxID=3351342 RepID=UPI0030B657E2
MSVYITGKRLMDMTAAHVHELYKMRVTIFVHEQQSPYQEIDDTDIHPGTQHILAYETDGGARLIGTARVFGNPTQAQHIGRVCVAAHARGQGIASQILDKALEVCKERAAGVDPTTGARIELAAQSYLVSWYEQFGFVVDGDEFDDTGIPHTPMVMRI